MSVIGERNAEILGSQLKLIGQDRSREIDVLPEVGNRDRVSIRTRYETLKLCVGITVNADSVSWKGPTANPLE